MKTEYGIPVPRGVQKDWEANSMGCEGAGSVLRRYHTPPEWGDPDKCVAWFDRFDRLRAIVGHYANSRAATVRIDANGKWTATFGRAPAQAGEAGTAATTKIDAVHEHAVGGNADAPTLNRDGGGNA